MVMAIIVFRRGTSDLYNKIWGGQNSKRGL